MDILPVRKQVIQSGRICKGSIFPHRGIEALLLAIGAEGRRIEGDNGRTAGLGPCNALDTRMDRLRHIHFSGDQALLPLPLAFAIAGIPGIPNFRIFLGKAAVHPKSQIAALHDLLPGIRKNRTILSLFRIPCIEESEDRLGCRCVNSIQEPVVQLCTGPEAIFAPLRFSLLIRTQQIAGIVPQEVRQDAGGTCNRSRQLHGCWAQLGLFPDLDLCQLRDHRFQHSVFVQAQCIADFCRSPSGAGNLALLNQVFKQPGQCLQDHVRTSSAYMGGTSRTPSRRVARKKWGVMFSGSE